MKKQGKKPQDPKTPKAKAMKAKGGRSKSTSMDEIRKLREEALTSPEIRQKVKHKYSKSLVPVSR